MVICIYYKADYLAARGAEGAVRRDGDGVEVTGVVIVVLLEPAVGQVPDLDHAVPTTRHDDGVVVVGGEADARHPVGVSFLLQGT